MTTATDAGHTLPPVWLLDIDGVINALGRNAAFRRAWPDARWIKTWATDTKGVAWPMTGAVPVMDFIRRVHDEGLAEIRWHTTWQDSSLQVGEAFELPPFKVHPASDEEFDTSRRFRSQWWKYPGALRVVEHEGRRLIWTDDDITIELTDRTIDYFVENHGSLVLCPNSITGLSPGDLDMIAEHLGVQR